MASSNEICCYWNMGRCHKGSTCLGYHPIVSHGEQLNTLKILRLSETLMSSQSENRKIMDDINELRKIITQNIETLQAHLNRPGMNISTPPPTMQLDLQLAGYKKALESGMSKFTGTVMAVPLTKPTPPEDLRHKINTLKKNKEDHTQEIQTPAAPEKTYFTRHSQTDPLPPSGPPEKIEIDPSILYKLYKIQYIEGSKQTGAPRIEIMKEASIPNEEVYRLNYFLSAPPSGMIVEESELYALLKSQLVKTEEITVPEEYPEGLKHHLFDDLHMTLIWKGYPSVKSKTEHGTMMYPIEVTVIPSLPSGPSSREDLIRGIFENTKLHKQTRYGKKKQADYAFYSIVRAAFLNSKVKYEDKGTGTNGTPSSSAPPTPPNERNPDKPEKDKPGSSSPGSDGFTTSNDWYERSSPDFVTPEEKPENPTTLASGGDDTSLDDKSMPRRDSLLKKAGKQIKEGLSYVTDLGSTVLSV